MKRLLVLLSLSVLLVACNTGPTVQSLTLKATDLQFDQTALEVQANQPVALEFVNNGLQLHDFSILEIAVTEVSDDGDHSHDMSHMTMNPQLHIAVEAGKTAYLTFTPTEPGTYEFFCVVVGHKEAGMVGQLIVK